MNNDELLTLKEAAKILKGSTRTLFTWLRRGDLAGHKAARGWRIQRSATERFLDERPGRRAGTARGGIFEAVNAAITKEDAGGCLHLLTMEGFSTEHFRRNPLHDASPS
jgi:excisionase family DNA binding protein